MDSALIVTRGQAANEAERPPHFSTSTVGNPAYITATVSDRPFTSIDPGADKVMTQFPANDSNVRFTETQHRTGMIVNEWRIATQKGTNSKNTLGISEP